ncbi:MAG: tRNA 2-thiouridine(34) synthase MnmA [Clostridiales bacterium]|nr:tRNA 2-thiouridine(34) synthase MnmA [Clostridiales bacterium]
MSRVVVGLSGGVDSAVSALLLKRQGFDVIGVFMNNWEEKDENGICTSQQDWNDVQDVCEQIGIPYYAVNFAKEYEERVFSHFLREYQAGRTPNPDVLCNREIKFKAFLDYAMKIGAEYMATGHFVKTNAEGQLLRGDDPGKEQSYFLYMLKKSQLKKSLFPVGGLLKSQVRAIAKEAGLTIHDKKDSTGICFIGERRFKQFLKNYLPTQPGDMVTMDGEVLGRHDGLMYYTIGQRKGLGSGGHGDGRSWFVARKDMDLNQLIVVQGEDHPSLYKEKAKLNQITWIDTPPVADGQHTDLSVKLRYRQKDQKAILTFNGEVGELIFDTPQRAVTPGQSAVFYQGSVCLGGGIVID